MGGVTKYVVVNWNPSCGSLCKRYYLITNHGTNTEFDNNLARTYQVCTVSNFVRLRIYIYGPGVISPAESQTLLQSSSSFERQIDLDVPRTMNTNIMFRTRY